MQQFHENDFYFDIFVSPEAKICSQIPYASYIYVCVCVCE